MESSKQSLGQNTTTDNCINGKKCVMVNTDDGIMVSYTIYDTRSMFPTTITMQKTQFEKDVRSRISKNNNCGRYIEAFQRLMHNIG
jgi:hypothetical protein